MSAERKRKKDGSVSEEAHGSWGSLITVMAAGETRGMKDTRDGVQQTWQESLSRDEMNQPIQQPSLLLLIWGCDITSSPRRSADGAGSRWSRSVLVKKKKKREGKWMHRALTYGLSFELLPVEWLPEAPNISWRVMYGENVWSPEGEAAYQTQCSHAQIRKSQIRVVKEQLHNLF